MLGWWIVALLLALSSGPVVQANPVQEHCVRQMTWDADAFDNAGAWLLSGTGNRSVYDLRGSNQHGPGPVTNGYVIATYDDPGNCAGDDVVISWTDFELVMSAQDKAAVRLALGIPGGLAGVSTYNDMIISLVTVDADPLATDIAGPRIADGNFVVGVWIGDTHVTRQITLNSREWESSLEGLRWKYGILADKAAAGDIGIDAHREALWIWDHKYKGANWPDFIPPGRPIETPIRPPRPGSGRLLYPAITLLTVTDDFETDTSGDWTAGSGTFTIDSGNSGYLEPTGTELVVMSDTDMGCDVHYAETTIDAISASYQGPMVRKDTTDATNTYWAMLQQNTGNDNVQLFWRNAGTYNFRQGESHVWATGELYRLDVDAADDLVMTIDTVAQGSPHSAAIGEELTGNVHHGVVSNNTATDFEDYSAVDSCGAPAARRLITVHD